MTYRVRIIIGILIVAILGVGIFFGVKLIKEKNKNKETPLTKIDMNEYLSNDKTENSVSNNVVNEIFDNTTNTIKTNNTVTNTYQGKEEGNSNSDIQMSNEEKAIDLAKKDWGSTSDYYNFEASQDSSDKNVYTVKVRNKSTTQEVTRYYVNISTGKVTE